MPAVGLGLLYHILLRLAFIRLFEKMFDRLEMVRAVPECLARDIE
jgi:hypothetical protein